MLYRFPISIYMIFSRLQHPQTLAALAQLRSFGKGREGEAGGGVRKHSPVCPQEHSESHTDSKRKRDRKNQNPQTFVLRLDASHPLHEYLDAEKAFFSWTYVKWRGRGRRKKKKKDSQPAAAPMSKSKAVLLGLKTCWLTVWSVQIFSPCCSR